MLVAVWLELCVLIVMMSVLDGLLFDCGDCSTDVT